MKAGGEVVFCFGAECGFIVVCGQAMGGVVGIWRGDLVGR